MRMRLHFLPSVLYSIELTATVECPFWVRVNIFNFSLTGTLVSWGADFCDVVSGRTSFLLIALDHDATPLRGAVVALLEAKARYSRAACRGHCASRRFFAGREAVDADLFGVLLIPYAGGTSGTDFIEANIAEFVLLLR